MAHRNQTIFLAVFLLALAPLLYPTEVVVAPEWNVKVVDEQDKPLQGAKVTEHWQHYSLDEEGQWETRTSDELGKVQFPARIRRAGILHRAVGCLFQFTKFFVHASCEAHAQLTVLRDGYSNELDSFERFVEYERQAISHGDTARKDSVLVLVRCKEGDSGPGCR